MSRPLFDIGAHGFLIVQMQVALAAAGFDPKGADGAYGSDTMAAVQGFQGSANLQASGAVDDVTWSQLMQSPIPSVAERALQLTSNFEGHGFGLASGNWDGAWLTWGIIGFTMKYGMVQQIIKDVNATAAHCLDDAFGADAPQLRDIMLDALPQDQKAWANSITAGSQIVDPWRTGFALLGSFPEVQAIQKQTAFKMYFDPAAATAQQIGLKNELGLALCFDISVQNGGIKLAARNLIQQQVAQDPPTAELDLRKIVANAVADVALPRFQADVRTRKLTIATGAGSVHGHQYVLAQWGLGELPA